MKENSQIQVLYQGKCVGRLALTGGQMAAFEYSDEWRETGFSISPFSLPLKKQVFVPIKRHFGGLFGVFADSLPDAWGELLLNRVLKKNGKNIDEITVLDRLSLVGKSGMGALAYEPDKSDTKIYESIHLDKLAEECNKILNAQYSENLDELYKLGGTSGGARPKILTRIENQSWMIKFPAHVDMKNAGEMEYAYSVCAKKCGIDMPETRLFPSKLCSGYYGVKRFDRIAFAGKEEEKKIHMCTAAALLEADFRQPCLDYRDVMKLTKILTKDDKKDMENMFLRMCFNVFAHNRDDHAKNFAYLYDDESVRWMLSPAYDMTYSSTYYGEHTTSVAGNGANPGESDLLKVGMESGLSKNKCTDLIDKVKTYVNEDLSKYMKKGF
ncbi:MAG: type II toxin-antitoxin system HipA family toxin [Lachnospiraceae bacterium]|nr:type II toxin-antitoxin system HipA family toxin [Lachnospiraceae bacterium]